MSVALACAGLAFPAAAGAVAPGADGRLAWARSALGIWATDAALANPAMIWSSGGTTADLAPNWSPDGLQVAYIRNGDIQRSTVAGANAQVAVTTDGGLTTELDPAWSPLGNAIAYEIGGQLFVKNLTSNVVTQLTTTGTNRKPAWSPDGTKIAYEHLTDSEYQVWTLQVALPSTTQTQLTTFESGGSLEPSWSPDGGQILFHSSRELGFDIYRIACCAATSGGTRLTTTNDSDTGGAWSPDGTRIAFQRRSGPGNETTEIYTASAVDGSSPVNRSNNADFDDDPDWQPVPSPYNVSLSASAYPVGEGAGDVTVTVTRDASGQPGSVSLATTNGSATAGSDYTAVSTSVGFATGETTKQVVIPILQDSIGEPAEGFTVTISGPGRNGTATAPTSAIVTINDDGDATAVSVGDATQTEGNTGTAALSLPVTLSQTSGTQVTVQWSLSAGTAAAGADYADASGTVTFAPNDISEAIVVAIQGDTLDEPDETLTVTLAEPTSAGLDDASATGTIADDDPASAFSVADTSVLEGDAETRQLEFGVRLDRASGKPVSVDWALAPGTATAGSDYLVASGTVTVAPGGLGENVKVTVNGDRLDEPDETLTITLSNAVNAGLSRAVGTGQITDDDLAGADTAAPVVVLRKPAKGSISDEPRPFIEGSAGSAAGDSRTVRVAFVQVRSNGQSLGGAATNVDLERTGSGFRGRSRVLAPGFWRATASQADAAGNVGRSQPARFRVDTRNLPKITLARTPGHDITDGPFMLGAHHYPDAGGTAGHGPRDAAVLTVRILAANGSEVRSIALPVRPDGRYLAYGLVNIDREIGRIGHFTLEVTQESRSPDTGRTRLARLTRTFEVIAPPVVLQAIDVSQGSQYPLNGVGNVPLASAPGVQFPHRQAAYSGVRLVRDKPVVVRAFVEARQGVRVLLFGSSGGRMLPGSPLSAENTAPPDLSSGAPRDKQQGQRGGFVFTLPLDWTALALDLTAIALPSGTSPDACAACTGNSALTLTGLHFTNTFGFKVRMIRLEDGGGDIRPLALEELEKAFNLIPTSRYGIHFDTNFKAAIDVSDVRDTFTNCLFTCTEVKRTNRDGTPYDIREDLIQRIFTWSLTNDYAASDFTLGIHETERRSLGAISSGVLNLPVKPVAALEPRGRPLTSTAHELVHGLGRSHASDACGGGANGQVGESWPPDQRGHLNGVGLDTLAPRTDGYYRIVSDLTADDQAYDLMSYCAESEAESWLSPRSWDAVVEQMLQAIGVVRAARERGASSGGLLVSAGLQGGSTHLLGVTPVAAGAAALTGSTSDYRARALDAAGQIVAETPLIAANSHVRGQTGTVGMLFAILPVAAAEKVEIVGPADAVVAEATASRSAPTVEIVAPRPGAVLGSAPFEDIRWKSADAEGGDLLARIEYSADGGASWKTLQDGRDTGSARIPRELLSAAKSARLRVQVSDGLRQTTATAGPFASRGAAPRAVILSPAASSAIGADGVINLAGQGWDDRGEPLSGRALSWFDGRRRVGQGDSVTLSLLTPGRHTLRLVARDRLARTGSESVRILVRGVVPQFLSLRAPIRVSRKARTFFLRVASSVPATLRVSGQTYRVGRTSHRLRVPIRPGVRPVRLALVLSAGPRRTRSSVTLGRR